MGLLVEPLEYPWHIGWHRDGVVEVPPEARDETVNAKLAEVWHDLRHFNQVNCAIYADSCTWFVPGSHLRQWDMPGEEQSTKDPKLRKPAEGQSNAEAERYCLEHCRQFLGQFKCIWGPEISWFIATSHGTRVTTSPTNRAQQFTMSFDMKVRETGLAGNKRNWMLLNG